MLLGILIAEKVGIGWELKTCEAKRVWKDFLDKIEFECV
jgi:hypothetical protein